MTTATEVGFVEMRIGKVVGVKAAAAENFEYVVVLDEVSGDRHLPIQIGQPEAFSLATALNGIESRRPMVYPFVSAVVRALGGNVRQVRIDRMVGVAYGASVEVEGPIGIEPVDARPSHARPGGSSWLACPRFPGGVVRGRDQARGRHCGGRSPTTSAGRSSHVGRDGGPVGTIVAQWPAILDDPNCPDFGARNPAWTLTVRSPEDR